jgi:hypothetical protein
VGESDQHGIALHDAAGEQRAAIRDFGLPVGAGEGQPRETAPDLLFVRRMNVLRVAVVDCHHHSRVLQGQRFFLPLAKKRPAPAAGGAVYTTSAPEGPGSLELNGSTGRAEVASLALGDHFTLSAWVRIPSGRTNIQTITANSGSGGRADGFRWFVNHSCNSDRRITFETGNGTFGSSAQTADNAFPYDQWNHVAVTVDRANGIARIYCNGTEATTSTRIRSDFATTAALDLGRMRTNTFYLGGGIDDPRILPGELTGTQIRAPAQDHLLARWTFNGSATDVSGNARDLVTVGTPTYPTDRVEGSHAVATGTPGYLFGGAVESGNEFSLSAWVKAPSGGPANIQTIFANSGGGTASGWSLYLNTYKTRIRTASSTGWNTCSARSLT